jgi:hypothetical protein
MLNQLRLRGKKCSANGSGSAEKSAVLLTPAPRKKGPSTGSGSAEKGPFYWLRLRGKSALLLAPAPRKRALPLAPAPREKSALLLAPALAFTLPYRRTTCETALHHFSSVFKRFYQFLHELHRYIKTIFRLLYLGAVTGAVSQCGPGSNIKMLLDVPSP